MSELVDPSRLEPYLAAHIPGLLGPIRVAKTPTGQSNPTFVLTAASGRYVLRRKPPGELLKSAHAVEREFRVMKALAETAVPVPKMLHLCEDEAVLGKPFFVMEHVAGETLVDPRCLGLAAEARVALYDAMNATLAALHQVDFKAVGLGDFGPPGDYFARQLTRWIGQYRATETGTLPQMEALIGWLEANLPAADGRAALVHGDYRLDNMLVDPATGAVRALVDWELSTIGHPLADLAGQVMQWALPVGEEGRGLDGAERAALGIPSDADYVETYAGRAGLTRIEGFGFALAFAFFRMAAILQGVKVRGLQGNASNPEKAARLGRLVPVYAGLALERIERVERGVSP